MSEEKRYFYAEINEEGICCNVSDLSGEVESPTMIPLETYDETLLGKKYAEGVWEEVPVEPTPEPEPTDEVSWGSLASAIQSGVNSI